MAYSTHHPLELSYDTFVSKQKGYSNLHQQIQNKLYSTQKPQFSKSQKTQLKFYFKPIIKLKSEWSLTSATALITEGSQRILDALFNSIKRNHNASVLVYKQGAAPCGHAVDVVFFNLGGFLKEDPYVVAKRTRGVDRTTWVGKRVEPE